MIRCIGSRRKQGAKKIVKEKRGENYGGVNSKKKRNCRDGKKKHAMKGQKRDGIVSKR